MDLFRRSNYTIWPNALELIKSQENLNQDDAKIYMMRIID